MVKRILFSIFLAVTAFSCLGLSNNITHYRLKFKASTPFLIESNAKLALPAGEYLLKETGQESGNLFSLERASDHKHMAFLFIVRIHQSFDKATLGTTQAVIFDLEDSSQLPVLKKFYPQGVDGYEILKATYVRDAGLIDVASLSKTKYTIIQKP